MTSLVQTLRSIGDKSSILVADGLLAHYGTDEAAEARFQHLVIEYAAEIAPDAALADFPPQAAAPAIHHMCREAGVPEGEVAAAVLAGQSVAQRVVPNRDKIGRNDSCWCGSGKKYKKCHGR